MRKRTAHGSAIRAIREVRGFSISEFAPRVGLSQSHLSRIELGGKQPTPERLRMIARALNVPVDAISAIQTCKCEETAA